MKFHEKFHAHMKQLGYSYKTLAPELGYSPTQIGNWVRGEDSPKVDQVQLIAKALGVTADYMLDETTDALDEEGLDADRKVREVIARFGPSVVWEILVNQIPKKRPAKRSAESPAERDAAVPPVIRSQTDPGDSQPRPGGSARGSADGGRNGGGRDVG